MEAFYLVVDIVREFLQYLVWVSITIWFLLNWHENDRLAWIFGLGMFFATGCEAVIDICKLFNYLE